ncbi:MAG TPA: IucA/IucC family protein [Stenotrophomonas sp.]|nr:IucA/IucC family protein [Stenotrophomonas sp.]
MSLLSIPGSPPALEHALLEQYLNTWCRETGVADLRQWPPRPELALPALLQQRRLHSGLPLFCLPLQGTGCHLAGLLRCHSLVGWHRVDECLWLARAGQWRPLTNAGELAALIADALAAGDATASRAAQSLKAVMRNSIAHARRYAQQPLPATGSAFVRGEQGLRLGHVFHVTSKASEGFGEDDLERYAPELGARFRLHYFAVPPALHIATGAAALASEPQALDEARQRLPTGDPWPWQLLPCHPWQAGHLLAQPAVAARVTRGELLSLGPLGELALPTSSVRTVWLPRWQRFLKLALDIRITNFVRNNPPAQVRRALDASSALARLPSAAVDSPCCRVLLETAAQSLAVDAPDLLAASTVLHRQALDTAQMDRACVMATVLEAAQGDHRIGLHALLQQAGAGHVDAASVLAWWRQYLEVTLQPLLALFLEHGVGLEAHLQNSLVIFDGGWPLRGVFRDMEGATLNCGCAAASGLAADSPALYAEDEAWRRLQYYLLVNHLGQVAAVLARGGVVGERTLWREIRHCLARIDHPLAAQLRRQPTLPAKANLLSSFAARGERPLWVQIPNPLRNEA